MPDQGVTLNARIQYKKDTDANWTSNNPVLLENELIIVEMENGECRFKIGDGMHPYVELPFISLGFSGVLGIEQGGTGATNATQARQHLEVPVSKLEFTASIDQILESGFYRVNEQADTPYQYSQMIVAHGGGDTVAQICIPYHSGHGNPKIRAGNPSSVGGLGSWDAWYDILTSAWPVSVAQGGTSSNTVAGARANLGIVRTTLYSGNLFSGSITLHDARNYRQLIVIGSPEAHASQMSQSVTTLDFTDSINMQLADNANWLGYKLTYSGDNLILTITSNANGGFITDVIGIG